jgi:hypothetical protein
MGGAAGLRPAVEPVLPARREKPGEEQMREKYLSGLMQYQGFFRAAGMPPSTAGGTPAATRSGSSWRRRNFIPQQFQIRVG